VTAPSELDALLDPIARDRQKALKVRTVKDINIPPLKYWEPSDPADQLKRHQRVGTTWLYLNHGGILADGTGLGKTAQAIALLCLMKERGELTDRAVVVLRPGAILQWRDEFTRFAPRLSVGVVVGDRTRRVQTYCSDFDVILIGYQMFLRDIDTLAKLDIGTIITDDVDPLRNEENATAAAARRMANIGERFYVMSATPLQTQLLELYNQLALIPGATRDLGTRTQVKRRYLREERISEYDPKKGKKVSRLKVVGYKNMNEFKELVRPWYLRRTIKDLDDGDMPDLAPPNNVLLDLYPAQQEAYEDLQRDVVKILTEEGEETKRATAWAKLQYAARITAGMSTLGFDDIYGESSVKMDWLVEKLNGDFDDEKIVVFCQYKDTIRAMQNRLKERGIGHVTFWGEESNPAHRRAIQGQFWEDRRTRVCLGTSAMEQSLNLQVSRILCNVDLLLNPARMAQLAGRVQRIGSKHKTVYVYNLLAAGTHETRSLRVLERRQAVSDFVFGETSQLFDQLSPMDLLHLIKP
jgi:SNF2 family DNA or RNA helicase